jgi:hypothetical protein
MIYQEFSLQKDGNPWLLYEDASQVQEDRSNGMLRLAVADGATESFCAGLWARLLASAFCHGQLDNGGFDSTLARIQGTWLEHISRRQLPWYAEEKARGGAFAALVGLTIETSSGIANGGFWQAFALGDSCLFHYREGKLLLSMPIEDPGQFGNNPYLISSRQENNKDISSHISKPDGIWQPGDHFLLMSDAVACWLMRSELAGAEPFSELMKITDESFVSWVEEKRGTRLQDGRPAMRNDDVTLVRLTLVEDEL